MLICHKVTSDGWTSYRMKGLGGLYLSRGHDQHPFCSEMTRKTGDTFCKKVGKKKKKEGRRHFREELNLACLKESLFMTDFCHTQKITFSHKVYGN